MKVLVRKHWIAVAATAVVLAACGGGGSDTTPADKAINKVKVAGDSLADVGTFGMKFTVQTSATTLTGPQSTQIFTDRVASAYGQTLCAHYSASTTGTFTKNATCTNYAVGGGRINNYAAPTSPVSVVQQIKDMSAAGFTAGDLVLIDGGGNDAGDLFGAYLAAGTDGGKSFLALTQTVLPAATVQGLMAADPANGLVKVGGAYMQALATSFANTVKTETVAKGAPRVAVLNMPGVTRTPKFRMVLASIAAAKGEAAAKQVDALFDGWVIAFNTQLGAQLTGDARVTVVDFYESFKDQADHPAQYDYTNVTTPVCPATGKGSDGLPTYSFATCTEAALSAATPPAGATGGANWWKTYGFSDSFHPTPFGHQLLSQLVSRSLARAGWL